MVVVGGDSVGVCVKKWSAQASNHELPDLPSRLDESAPALSLSLIPCFRCMAYSLFSPSLSLDSSLSRFPILILVFCFIKLPTFFIPSF